MNSKMVVILDGGTGMTLIEKMGHKNLENDPLWSADVVKSHPEDLIKLHKEFYLSGSDVVVTATYQASVEGYVKKFGLSETEALGLIRKGVELARTARDEAEKETGRSLYVAASVGPYGAVQADWSEYDGRYAETMTKEELIQWHIPRLRALVAGQPDLLAIETIPALKEAEAILEAVGSVCPHTKAWVTFQCQNGDRTAHKEPIAEAVRTVCSYNNVVAVGVNCVHPSLVTPLLDNIHSAEPKVPVCVKPNAGRFEHDGVDHPKEITDFTEEWLQHGASWIGGCCHIFASDIVKLRDKLKGIPHIQLLRAGDTLL